MLTQNQQKNHPKKTNHPTKPPNTFPSIKKKIKNKIKLGSMKKCTCMYPRLKCINKMEYIKNTKKHNRTTYTTYSVNRLIQHVA